MHLPWTSNPSSLPPLQPISLKDSINPVVASCVVACVLLNATGLSQASFRLPKIALPKSNFPVGTLFQASGWFCFGFPNQNNHNTGTLPKAAVYGVFHPMFLGPF